MAAGQSQEAGPVSPVYRLVDLSDATLAAATEDAGVWIRTRTIRGR